MASEKEDYSFAIMFNESWLKFYWKSMATIESSNKLSVTKKNLQELECATIEK